MSVPATGPGRPSRSTPLRARLRAALLGAALLLGAGMAAAAPDLHRLDSLVRRGDADALAQLLQAADGYGAQAPYAEQLRYLRLLAQAYRDAGEIDAAGAADQRIARLAGAQGDSVNAALGPLGQVSRLLGKDPAAALAALGGLDLRYAPVRDPAFIATVQRLYGDVYVALGQFDFGLGHYLKALEIARAHPELLSPRVAGLPPRAHARVFLHKGIAEVMLERPARAAQAAARQAGDAEAIRTANANLGFALLGQGRLAEGRSIIDAVVAQMRAAHALPDLADVLAEEGRALERAGRVKEALAILREHEEVVARLASSEREKTVAVLQEQFNAQQRAIQIEGLRHENLVKDLEIQRRRVWQLIASSGTVLALLLCGFVYRLYRRSQRTQRQLELLNTELAFHSTHDALTGLLNRRSFREHMLVRDERAERDPARFPAECFVLIDIDHFKAINDRHGHGAGDEVLVEVARRLREAVGERGLLMRWGGEEFLVYVESLDAAGHADLVRALLDTLAEAPVAIEGGHALAITLTAGALSLPERAGDGDGFKSAPGWQQALALADHALYRGKQEGRNRAYLIDGAATGARALQPELILPEAGSRQVVREAVA